MIYLVIILIVVGIIAAIVELSGKKTAGEKPVEVKPLETSCSTCVANDLCEADMQLREQVKPIEYYNDEELDSYKGRAADSYTDTEVDEFSDVLYTLRQNEVRGWLHSINARGIALPQQLQDEAYALLEK